MTFLFLVLIVACLAGAYILNRNAKAQGAAGAPLALVLVVLALILIVVKMLVSSMRPEGDDRAQIHVGSYQTAQATISGRKVAERHPQSRVTVLVPPKAYGLYRAPERLDELRDVLVKEMENAGLQVQTKQIPLPPNPGGHSVTDISEDELDPASEESAVAVDMTQYFMEYYTTRRFSRIVLDQQDADVVICLFDLPMGIDGRALPRKGKGPALVMLYDNVEHLSSSLSSSILDAVVLRQNPQKPWDYEQSLPRDPAEGFAKWFYWVTAESAGTISHSALD